MMSLKGQTAIVTGGGRGIGRAICLPLAGEGADIVIAARTGKEIRETARMVERNGGRALAVKTDLRAEEFISTQKRIIPYAVVCFLGNK